MSLPGGFDTALCLNGARLQLRPMQAGDAEQWLGIMADPEVMRYWHHGPWQALAEAEVALLADRAAYLAGRSLKMDDFGTASIWVIEDVSDQRRAELAIQQTKERLELAQEAGKIGVFDLNLLTGEILWSDKLAQMMGLPPGTQPDGRDFWLNCLHPEDRPQAAAYFDSCLAGNEDHLRDSWRIVRPDGEVRWFLEAARIFRNEQGQPVIDEVGALGGDGGLIALDAGGNIADPYNSQGMKRAWLTTDGEVGVEVFDQ